MSLTRINGRNGQADFKIATQSYSAIMRRFSLESNVPMDDVTTFSTEAAPVYDPGFETLRFDLMGFNTYGTAYSGPLIPAPQNVALTFKWFTACQITGTGNFTRAAATREVGTNSIITGEGVIAGAFVVTWDLGS